MEYDVASYSKRNLKMPEMRRSRYYHESERRRVYEYDRRSDVRIQSTDGRISISLYAL